jgi:hypothetical protein
MHSLVLIDCDKTQHERLVRVLNSRRYDFVSKRKGYNRPHVSEVRLYNIRAKKEVMPYVLQDLGVESLLPEKKIRLFDIIRGPKKSSKDAFFDGRGKLFAKYIMQKIGKLVRITPAKISNINDRKRNKLVDGWYYPFHIGNIEDIDRGWGEEL